MSFENRQQIQAIGRDFLASLPRSARNIDGTWNWKDVSNGLHDLQSSLEESLRTQEIECRRLQAELQHLETEFPTESTHTEDAIDTIRTQLELLLPDVQQADSHFHDVQAVLAPFHQQLCILTTRATYLEIAIQVEKHSQRAKKHAKEATMDALDSFQAFSSYIQTIPIEYAALRSEAVRRMDILSSGIKQCAIEKLQQSLDAVQWPNESTPTAIDQQQPLYQELQRSFGYLIALQQSQYQAEVATSTSPMDTNELWAMKCLLEPVGVRFQYHFERMESKTNRLTKPEWYLLYILDQTRLHQRLLNTFLTPMLEKYREIMDCVDATLLFLRGFIRLIMHKIQSDLPVLLTQRAVFCHLVDEILLFEETIDQEFQYGSYALCNRARFPRCCDVLSGDPTTLFTWAKTDREYAQETIKEWMDRKQNGWRMEQGTVPIVVSQFMTLLDFLCRRLAPIADETHRYLYVTTVHFVLLQQFHQDCQTRYQKLQLRERISHQQTLVDTFGLINGVNYVVEMLSKWEQSPLFLELLHKVVESKTSRSHILKMHLKYSTTSLKNAAKAASKTIMATEEATAVRHAIAGPGAMIGPTAALSAAYSDGSKTVKSLFGREQVSNTSLSPTNKIPNQEEATRTRMKEEEALLFSRTIFERQVTEYQALVSNVLSDVQHVVLSIFEHALSAYTQSSHWTQRELDIELAEPFISPELGAAFTVLHMVLSTAKSTLTVDVASLWKPLIVAMDEAIVRALVSLQANSLTPSFNLSSAAAALGATSSMDSCVWSKAGISQFLVDMEHLAAVFNVCAKTPKAYLRKTFDLCRLIEMPNAKRVELLRAMDDKDAMAMEQITTMLEACHILSLTPQQVHNFCIQQLGDVA